MSNLDLNEMAAAIRATPAPDVDRFEKHNRTAIARWTSAPRGGDREALAIRGYHFKSSRTYVITAQPMTVTDDSIGQVESYSPLDSIRLHVERADRYSEKHLRDLHAGWVMKVRAGDAGEAVAAALAEVLGG